MAAKRDLSHPTRTSDEALLRRVSSKCRLCGSQGDYWGSKRLLHQYDVDYFLCTGCGSLQTEEPYWLDEAYDVSGVRDDVGAAQRTLDLTLKSSALLHSIGLPGGADCIDFGGGVGLFTRMMRDRGFNFRSFDRYAKPFFSDRFSLSSLVGASPAVVTAFEVLEHFANPEQDLHQLFDTRPALVIATTELFAGQNLNWPYLSEGSGQHVFFYSREALAQIARRFEYRFGLIGGLVAFAGRSELEAHGMNPAQVTAALKELSQGDSLMRKALALFMLHQRAPYEHVLKDVEALSAGAPQGSGH